MNQRVIVLCVGLAAFTAGAQEAATDRGIAFGVHLGDRIANLAFAGQVSVIEGGFFAGFKFSRVIAGLKVDATRIGIGPTNVITLMFVPGVQVALLHSGDGKVELFAHGDVGVGPIIVEGGGSTTGGSGGTAVRYALGPGLRYWLHPQLGVAMLAALRGDLSWIRSFPGGPDTATSAIGIVAVLQFMGLFPI